LQAFLEATGIAADAALVKPTAVGYWLATEKNYRGATIPWRSNPRSTPELQECLGEFLCGELRAAGAVAGDYVINGSKMWITNGAQADWICLLANTGEGAPHRNKSLLCVPMKTPGVTVAGTIRKIGMHASDTAEIHFDHVKVQRQYLIGEEGAGFTYQMQQFQEERLWVAASALVTLENAIARTIDCTRQRSAFGRSILDNQVVHFRLAELRTEVEALRALTCRAADLLLAGEDVTMLALMAKLKAGRLLR